MSSDAIAISVRDVGKRYEMYETPRDRLKQFVLPRLASMSGVAPKQYFKEFWALKGISFDVKKGESVGIMGRNGSGKSTLLQIVTGTLAPTCGTVQVSGRVAALLELGSGFNPEFTGRENVYLNGALLGFSKQQMDDRFDAIASFADIGPHLEQPVKTYSSGMMLRLAFAVQVQVGPDILIVDEALAVGDALFQKRCFQRIEKLVSDGTTLLFVSHDQESVRTLTHRAVLLNKGAVVTAGASSEVVLDYRRLLHEEEAAYYGSLAQDLAQRAEIRRLEGVEDTAQAVQSNAPVEIEEAHTLARSEALSFGDGHVKIVSVETLDGDNAPCSMYYPGDVMRIRVTCESEVNINRLNVGIRLRNREGVKIYSWGTLNQDMRWREPQDLMRQFWRREIHASESFSVELECVCTLGVNLYEVQASVTYEESPDYLGQRMLHWMDEAAFFQVSMRRDENFFGGVVDLGMTARW